MKRMWLMGMATVMALAGAGTVMAGQYTGLWVGDVTVTHVNEVNKQSADLSFDLALDGVRNADLLLPRASVWNYIDDGAERASDWKTANVSGSWSSGSAAFGSYPGSKPAYVNKQINNVTTTYFRKDFEVTDAALYSTIKLSLLRDAGVIIYLNGAEILRNNLPVNYVGNTTYALGEPVAAQKGAYLDFIIPAVNLLTGTNRLAVELHRSSLTDTDTSFDLELAANLGTSQLTRLLPMKSTWKYNDTGTDLLTAWYATAYDDTSWSSGKGKFGYGNTAVGNGAPAQDTQISYGSNSNKYPAYYFRTTFTVPDPAGYSSMQILLQRDDGAVVYLNGAELVRSNMPASGAITYSTPPLTAVDAADAARYQLFTVPASVIVAGTNTIAVEVHQHPDELSDRSASAPTKAGGALPLRLLLHVNASGDVSLLKQVYIMADAVNKRPVLLTDDSKLAGFGGIAVKDGQLVGTRLSAIGFDYSGNEVACSGAISTTTATNCTVALPRTLPTNPFLHRYHPDHDGLDAQYQPIPEASSSQEVLEINRAIELGFSTRYPADPLVPVAVGVPPGWGYDQLGGIYRETITGLHKDPLKVQGYFTMRRVSTRDALNQ